MLALLLPAQSHTAKSCHNREELQIAVFALASANVFSRRGREIVTNGSMTIPTPTPNLRDHSGGQFFPLPLSLCFAMFRL